MNCVALNFKWGHIDIMVNTFVAMTLQFAKPAGTLTGTDGLFVMTNF